MREELIRKINEILDTVTDTWILEQIYKFCIGMTKEEQDMPRVAIKKKEYKVLDLKGWVSGQMKIHGLNQTDIGKALGLTQATVSHMLIIPKKEKDKTLSKIDTISYGDLLTLFDLFDTPDEEKIRLLTL